MNNTALLTFLFLFLLFLGLLINDKKNPYPFYNRKWTKEDNESYITKVQSFQSPFLNKLTDDIQLFFDDNPKIEYLDIKYQNTGTYYTALLIYQTPKNES